MGARGPGEGGKRRLHLAGALQSVAEQAPSIGFIGKRFEQPREQRSGFGITELKQRRTGEKGSIGSVGRKHGGAAEETNRFGKVFGRAGGAASKQKRRHVIRPPRQTCRSRTNCMRHFPAPQGDLGKELMNGGIVRMILQQALCDRAGCIKIPSPHGGERDAQF